MGIPIGLGLAVIFGLSAWFLGREVVHSTVGSKVLMTGLLVALVGTIPTFLFVVYLDRRAPEPWWVIADAFLWGAIVATSFGLALESLATDAVADMFYRNAALVDTSQLGIEITSLEALFERLQTSLIAPLVEEGVKGIALVLLFVLLPTETTNMRDGIVLGMLVGLGFTVVEATAFITAGYADSGQAFYLGEMVRRFALLGMSGHVVFTAIFGAGLGWARQTIEVGRVRKGLMIAGAFTLAVWAHAMGNAYGPLAMAAFASYFGLGPTVTVAQLWLLRVIEILATNAWAYVIFGYVVVRSGYWEMWVIRSELSREGPPAVTPEERQLLVDESLWRQRRIPAVPRRVSRRIVTAQNELAFRRRDLRRGAGDPDKDPLMDFWRGRIAAARAGIDTASEGAPR